MPRHLFDDIPWKKGAQYEHDCFADILRSEGTEVVYIEDLFRESFDREGSRGAFLSGSWTSTASITAPAGPAGGIPAVPGRPRHGGQNHGRRQEGRHRGTGAADFCRFFPDAEYELYYTEPLANLYYTRDPGSSIGRGMSFHNMEKLGRGAGDRGLAAHLL